MSVHIGEHPGDIAETILLRGDPLLNGGRNDRGGTADDI